MFSATSSSTTHLMQTKSLLLSIFEYKAWANKDLFSLLKKLPITEHLREQHDATRILNHIYVVDQIFIANLQGKAHTFTALNTPETPSIAALHTDVEVADCWFIDYINSLTDASFGEIILFTFVDGSPGKMSRGEMLLHLATHGNYHRGAVGRILTQISITPPRDTLTVFLHSSNN